MNEKNKRILLLDSILLGVVGAVAAQLFLFLLRLVKHYSSVLIAGYDSPGLSGMGGTLIQTASHHHHFMVIAVIVFGGLISGILVYTFAPEAEGHGTDTAVRAFHRTGGLIRACVTPLKMIASALTIGTGGSAGREGPTALFSAGIGSIYATIKKSSNRDRRLLVLVGMASGLSAIFKSPIGTAIFAVEVLYGEMEFEASALVYTLLGSVVAYMVSGFFVGWQPLFDVPQNLLVTDPETIFYLLILGGISGIVGVILPNVFYGIRDLFHSIPIAPHFKPAIGALCVGLIAIVFPQVLGGGYGWIQKAIDGQIFIWLLPTIIIAKMFAFAFTVSSGGSGGVFAPSLFLGALLGSFLALLFHQSTAVFAMIGMAAVFGAAARVPLATVIMVTEMTGGYRLLAPAALTVLLAYLLQVSLVSMFNLKYKSLYEAQVPDRSFSPVHQIDELRNILSFYTPKLSLNPKRINRADLLSLLESSIPIDIPNGKQIFFGSLKNDYPKFDDDSKCELFYMKYKDAEVMAMFRDGSWIYPQCGIDLQKGDELLLMGTPDVIDKIRIDFNSVSKTFSQLSVQQQKLDQS